MVGTGDFLLDELKTANKAVGVKQCEKMLRAGRAKKAFVALDAADNVKAPLEALCQSLSVPVEYADGMKTLGKACEIDVGAAIAVIF